MPILQSDIDNLNTAIATGVRSALVGGQQVTYNTSQSLIEARDNLQKLFNRQNSRPSRQNYAVQAGRGYDCPSQLDGYWS
jgi:hypothetical protein